MPKNFILKIKAIPFKKKVKYGIMICGTVLTIGAYFYKPSSALAIVPKIPTPRSVNSFPRKTLEMVRKEREIKSLPNFKYSIGNYILSSFFGKLTESLVWWKPQWFDSRTGDVVITLGAVANGIANYFKLGIDKDFPEASTLVSLYQICFLKGRNSLKLFQTYRACSTAIYAIGDADKANTTLKSLSQFLTTVNLFFIPLKSGAFSSEQMSMDVLKYKLKSTILENPKNLGLGAYTFYSSFWGLDAVNMEKVRALVNKKLTLACPDVCKIAWNYLAETSPQFNEVVSPVVRDLVNATLEKDPEICRDLIQTTLMAMIENNQTKQLAGDQILTNTAKVLLR